MLNTKLRFFYILLLCILPASCSSDKGCTPITGPPEPVDPVNRTLFIYMGADNNGLYPFDEHNISDIVAGATSDNIGDGRIIIFHDRSFGNPQLLQVMAGKDGRGEKKVLRTYRSQKNSANPAVFVDAVYDMMLWGPAENYGLIMWSHGTGWLPGSISARSANDEGMEQEPRTVIQDGRNNYMELTDFTSALSQLPDKLFDFMIFDECYMAGAEVAWALRGYTDHLIVSAAEVVGEGMPYSLILPHLFAENPRLGAGGVCQAFFEYHDNSDKAADDFLRTATISLFDCNHVDDSFADLVKDILAAYTTDLELLSPGANLQHYDRYDTKPLIEGVAVNANLVFELGDLINEICPPTDPRYAALQAKLSQIIKYSRSTSHLCELPKDISRYTGMTVYIPFKNDTRYTALNRRYKYNSWYQRVYPAGYIND